MEPTLTKAGIEDGVPSAFGPARNEAPKYTRHSWNQPAS